MEDFSTFVSAESANATLESSTSDLRMSSSSGKVEWTLQTPEGQLEIKQMSTKTVQTTKTSEGTLTEIESGGTVKTNFRGSDRQEVEKARDELKQRMEQKKEQLDQKRKELKDTAMSDVEVILNESTASGYEDNSQEHVVIVNNDVESIELDGWKLQNNDPDTYKFNNIELEAGERLKVYSSDADELEDIDGAVTGTGLTWENSEDTATLLNDEGSTVDTGGF